MFASVARVMGYTSDHGHEMRALLAETAGVPQLQPGSLLTTVPLNFVLPCVLFWMSFRDSDSDLLAKEEVGSALPLSEAERQATSTPSSASALPFAMRKATAAKVAAGLAIACALINLYAFAIEVVKEA